METNKDYIRFPALVQRFNLARPIGASSITTNIEEVVSHLSDTPQAIVAAAQALTRLSTSPGLVAVISLTKQAGTDLSNGDISNLITHLLVTAKSESNNDWFVRNATNHFGLIQQSRANWDHGLDVINARLSKIDGRRSLATLAADFGIPVYEINYLKSKFGATDSKFYQIPAIAGALLANWTNLCRQFTWTDNGWTPRIDAVINSPRWLEIKDQLATILRDKDKGMIALLSLIHVNGPNWFTGSKVRHLKRIIEDGLHSSAITTAPIVASLSSVVRSKLSNVGNPDRMNRSSVVKDDPVQPNHGGWLDKREDGSIHFGVDYAVPQRTPIFAPVDGEVTSVFVDTAGNNARFVTPDGFKYVFAHLDTLPSKGVRKKGEVIGYTGATGYRVDPRTHKASAYRAHFHLSVRAPESHVDLRPNARASRHANASPYFNPNYAPIKPINFLMRPDVSTH